MDLSRPQISVIRPPDYFPGIPFLRLMAAADVVVLADTFRYSRQSHQNRMRIRSPEGSRWLSIPLKGGKFGKPVTDVQIDYREQWVDHHLKTLEMNYRASPFFPYYEEELKSLLEATPEFLSDLTVRTSVFLHGAFGLSSRIVSASELMGQPVSIPDILEAVRASSVLTLSESAPYDARSGVPILVLDETFRPYRQVFPGFEPGMCGLDLLFNYGPESYPWLRTRQENLHRFSETLLPSKEHF